jgi:hypothetical protein
MSEAANSSASQRAPGDNERRPNTSNLKNASKKSSRRRPGGKNVKPSLKKGSSKRDIRHDYRYLEIVKLIKTYKPVTINGTAVKTIIERTVEAGQPNPEGESVNSISDPVHRFLSRCISEGSPIYILMMFTPADPDFPYDLDILKINLCVPAKYPQDTLILPSIYVLNEDIPRGFAINIESGFTDIARLATGKHKGEPLDITLAKGRGLLSQIQTLDKNLESFLKKERRETVKIVTTKKKKPKTASTPVTPTPPPVASPVRHAEYESAKAHSTVAQQQLEEFSAKMLCRVTTRKGRESCCKIALPVHNTAIQPPAYYVDKGAVDVWLRVPLSYPESKAYITIPGLQLDEVATEPNVDRTLASAQQIQNLERDNLQQKIAISRAAGAFEENVKQIPDYFPAARTSLVALVNFAANNFGMLCLDRDECADVLGMLAADAR